MASSQPNGVPSRFTRNPDRFARRESDLRPETYTSLLVVNLEGEILHLDGEGAPALFYGFSVGGERHTSLSDVLRRVPELEGFLQQAFQGETATGEIRRWGKVWLASCRPLREEGRVVGAVCLLQDEHAWRERYFVPQAVTALSAALRKAATAAELQTVLFAQLQEWIPLDGGAVFLLPFEEHALNRYFGRWEQAAISASEEFNAWLRVMGQQLLSTAQVYYNAAQRIGEREAVVMGVPLLARSEAVGALWVEARSPLRAEERRLLETVGALVASALYRIQKYQQTEHRLQRLAALHAIERALTQTFDLSLSLQVLLEQLTRHFSIDAADVLFYDDQMHLLRRVAHLGFRAPLQEETLGVREGLPARVVRSRAQLVVNDLSRSPFVSPRLEALRKDEGFAAYCGFPLISRGQLLGVLELFQRAPLQVSDEWLNEMHSLCAHAAVVLDNIRQVDALRQERQRLHADFLAGVEAWVHLLCERSGEDPAHLQRLAQRTLLMARALDIPAEQLEDLHLGVLLHDAGMIKIPEEVLFKRGKLSAEEWNLVRRHPQIAYDMFSAVETLRPALEIPLYHHERWDGSGYPFGLKGSEIPLLARLFAIVDVWDALSRERPFRGAWEAERVVEYIFSQAGRQFDPALVEVWAQVFNIPLPEKMRNG